jgi:hypothetical protein
VSYAIAGYLATAVVFGSYLSWVVIRSREVAAQVLAIRDAGGVGSDSDGELGPQR